MVRGMICRPAEATFQKGARYYSEGRFLEAQALFEASLALSKEFGEGPIQPRYLSFYGACLSRNPRRLSEAVELCEKAVASEPYNPDLWLNLAQVALARRDRASAVRAIERGLQASPSHGPLIDQLRKIGQRRRPFLPFLSRDFFLNIIAGKLTYRSRKKRKRA
jgi:tetratricopeptide (TPR) repeat protein